MTVLGPLWGREKTQPFQGLLPFPVYVWLVSSLCKRQNTRNSLTPIPLDWTEHKQANITQTLQHASPNQQSETSSNVHHAGTDTDSQGSFRAEHSPESPRQTAHGRQNLTVVIQSPVRCECCSGLGFLRPHGGRSKERSTNRDAGRERLPDGFQKGR